MTYFSDREGDPVPQVEEELTNEAWGGIVAIATSNISTGAFGIDYPYRCQGNEGIVGTDEECFRLAVQGKIKMLTVPLDRYNQPSTMDALDLIEFCHEHVAAPNPICFHKYFNHHHLSFDREAGQKNFRKEVNSIFRRNGLAYELKPDGHVVRLGPLVLRDTINKDLPKTDDDEFNNLLITAVDKFISRDPNVRKEALEKLWDAWERLKTTFSSDKRTSAKTLLDKAAKEPALRKALEDEAKELTRIGNAFQIRHFEIDKTPITESEHVDYLFHRMFSLILLLVKALK